MRLASLSACSLHGRWLSFASPSRWQCLHILEVVIGMNEKAGKGGVRMKHLANLHEIEMAVVHDIKKRNCRRHTGGCRGCALFVDRESGLDCAAMMMEPSLEEEKKS